MIKTVYLISISIFILFSSFSAKASNCEVLLPNSSDVITTETSPECVIIKHLNIGKTFLVLDADFQKKADYQVDVLTVANQNVFSKSITSNSISFSSKLNTNFNSEIKVVVAPSTNNKKYDFYVVHDENTLTNETTIYIGLNSDVSSANTPPPTGQPIPPGGSYPDEPCDFSNPYGPDFVDCQFPGTSSMTTTSSTKGEIPPKFTSSLGELQSLSTAVQGEAAQCNTNNRPPQSAPTNRETGQELNVNAVLRVSGEWMATINQDLSHGASSAAAFARLKAMHEAGGALDIAHDTNSDWVGSYEMGNFLYGANARAMGFSYDAIERGGAFYTPIGDNGWGWGSIAQGIYNFLFNTGNSPGDTDEELRGARYYDEVFLNNQTDTSSFSCLDEATLDAAADDTSGGSNGGGGGGGGGYTPPGNVGGGFGGGFGHGDWPTAVCYRELPDGNGGLYILIVDCP